MSKLIAWLAMNGYSIYIWPAYGLVCMVLLMNCLSMKVEQFQTRKKLQAWFKRQQV